MTWRWVIAGSLALVGIVWALSTARGQPSHDAMQREVDRAVAYVAGKTSYSTEGLAVRWRFISPENLFYMFYPPPPTDDVKWYTYERALETDGPRPEAATTAAGMTFASDFDVTTDRQLLIHEIVHVLQFHNDAPKCIAGKSWEHEAYRIQEEWLVENEVPESDWIVPGPVSRVMVEMCPDRWHIFSGGR